ncbi:unnamed protein product, partial [Closterium sp. NIES-53]
GELRPFRAAPSARVLSPVPGSFRSLFLCPHVWRLCTIPPHWLRHPGLLSAHPLMGSSCSCRVLSHPTLLWPHRLGHPSLPRLRGMHSRLLVSGLPRSLPSLLCSPSPPCLPCVEGRQRAAPHSSKFPPTTAPLQTLHMDVWGPAPIGGTDQECYFLLVVDDYTRYTTVFPFGARRTRDFPFLRLHSDKGGEFSSDLLAEFCRDEGIHQPFTLPASPQQNGIAKRRIGLIMEVARTSMIRVPHSTLNRKYILTGSGGSGGGGGGSGGSSGSGGGGTGGGRSGARRVGSGGGQRQQQRRRSEAQNEAHHSAILPCSRVAAAWPASSCIRGQTGQHC